MQDNIERKITYLRLSITDSCNLRCKYCLPEKVEYKNKKNLLTPKEIEKIVGAFALLGVNKIRITGGEPLVRKDFLEILSLINKNKEIKKIAITTNGLDLEKNLEQFKKNGLKSLNLSLDSLNAEKYKEITRGGDFFKVFSGLKKAIELQMEKIKINVVVMEGINDNEIKDFVELTKFLKIGVRFIELMPIGEGKNFKGISNEKILEELKKIYEITEIPHEFGDGPAKYYKVKGYAGEIGFISPLSNKFCDSCNRVRVTSEGFLKLCLHYNKGIDLKRFLKEEITIEELAKEIKNAIYEKPKEHKMNSSDKTDIDSRKMNEIGG